MNIRKITIFTFIFSIVALAVGLSGCERIVPIMPDGEMPSMEAPEVTIGVAVALTGEYAEPYGLPMKRGLELARDELEASGANIRFIFEDPQSTVEGGKNAVQKLVNRGVSAIVGIGISTHLEQAFPIAQDAGVVAISPISSAAGLSGQVGNYAFRIGLATDVLTPTGVSATKEKLDYENVAMIYDAADTYSTSSYEELKKALEGNSVTILSTETFETKAIDFTTQLTNIMNLDPQPDALFIAALSTEMVEIIKQAGDLGITDTVDLVVPDLTNAEAQAAGGAAEGAVTFAGWSNLFDTPGNQDFIQKYMEEHGFAPSPWAAQAYATLYILAQAIAKAESTDSAAIRDALAQTMSFPTVLGNFSFDSNGEAMYDQIDERVALIVENGKLKVLE